MAATALLLAAAHPLRARPPDGPPERIVCLVPSLTEVLVELGAADRLVARTRYDRQPELAHLPSVGGTIRPSLEVLIAARPGLVLAWADEGSPRTIRRLRDRGIRVRPARVRDFADLRRHVRDLGRLVGRAAAADSLLDAFDRRLAEATVRIPERRRPTVAFVVWPRPLSVAGPGTYADRIIRAAGGRNAFADAGRPWPRPSPEAMVARDPDVLLFAERRRWHGPAADALDGPPWSVLSAVRRDRVVRLPAELIERPGLDAPRAVRLLADRLRALADAAGTDP